MSQHQMNEILEELDEQLELIKNAYLTVGDHEEEFIHYDEYCIETVISSKKEDISIEENHTEEKPDSNVIAVIDTENISIAKQEKN